MVRSISVNMLESRLGLGFCGESIFDDGAAIRAKGIFGLKCDVIRKVPARKARAQAQLLIM